MSKIKIPADLVFGEDLLPDRLMPCSYPYVVETEPAPLSFFFFGSGILNKEIKELKQNGALLYS